LDDRLRPDDRSGAGAIFHDDGLAEPLRQLVCQRPPDDVIAAGRPDRHDDLDRAVGIGLCRRKA
jgi:hypothetical protein